MDYFGLMEEIEKGEISNLYLLEGREDFFLAEILQRLKKILLQDDSCNYITLNEEKNSLLELEEITTTLPFLNSKKLIIYQASHLLTGQKKEEEKLFLKIIENLPSFSYLLILAGEKVDKRKKVYQQILQIGKIVEINALKPWKLEEWLIKKAAQLGKNMDKQIAQYIIQITGKDLFYLEQELEKVFLYLGQKERVEKEDLQAILSKQGEQNIFAFLDALGQREQEKALFTLKNLFRLGEQPLKVVFMIHHDFRLLWQVKLLKEKGYAKTDMLKKMQMKNSYPLEKALTRIDNFSWSELDEIMDKLLTLDYQIKSIATDSILLLQVLTIKICQRNKKKS